MPLARAVLAAGAAFAIAGCSERPASTPSGAAPDVAAQTDTTGKDAVLCSWRIYAGALEIGELCHPGEDAALKAELARSVTRVERFIVAHSSTGLTQKTLDAQKADGLAELNGRAVCATTAPQLYHGLRNLGAEALRAEVDHLLSVPREPVLNPCL